MATGEGTLTLEHIRGQALVCKLGSRMLAGVGGNKELTLLMSNVLMFLGSGDQGR